MYQKTLASLMILFVVFLATSYPSPAISGGKFELTGDYNVQQGKGRQDLGVDAKEGFCFLTGISGKFEGRGEEVRVYTQKGRWFLEVRSKQRGVSGRARRVKLIF